MNYEVIPIGQGERILPAAITAPTIVEGSSVPIMIRHAGIAKVERYSFEL